MVIRPSRSRIRVMREPRALMAMATIASTKRPIQMMPMTRMALSPTVVAHAPTATMRMLRTKIFRRRTRLARMTITLIEGYHGEVVEEAGGDIGHHDHVDLAAIGAQEG